MAIAYNKSQVILTIDGSVVEQLAATEDAVLCPDSMPALEVTVGAQGDLMAVGTGMRGGPISVTVLPVPAGPGATGDPAWQAWDELLQRARDGEEIEPFDGSLEVPNRTYTLSQGFCIDGPMGQTYGQGNAANRTYVHHFEEIRTG